MTDDKKEDLDEDANDEVAAFRSLVFALASCRPDVLAPKNRKALIDEVQDKLERDDGRMRKVLADWKGEF
jgi:hypothetical protein